MKEIGGYIELDQHSGILYHDRAIALNCGRAALEYLIRAKNIKKIYLPYFCCDSIAQPCRRCGIEFEFYHINEDFRPDIRKKLNLDEWLYIVNYYGQLSNDDIKIYKEKYVNIIIDNAQAYFQMPVDNVDTLYTCRKFFGVSDGAFVYTDAKLEGLERDESFERIHYILGRFERTASAFYNESVENNDNFEHEPLKFMSKLTDNLLRTIDYEYVKEKRKMNFEYLHEKLKNKNILKITVPDGAFMYPFYCKNGVEVRKQLISNRIYIPVLWPDVMNVDSNALEREMVQNILPLPVDQRYGEDEMNRIVTMIEGEVNI